MCLCIIVFFFQAEDGIRDRLVTGVQTCALPSSLQGLLVTRGSEGMTLFTEDGECIHQSSNVRQVYDVSGAGDTVVAAIAVFLACGMSWNEILKYADTAAGIAVGKFGTATVTLPEILSQLERETV